ncbi:hypothetical protein [Cellulomonas dongxiuzhuiae]|nr:hypothetical protein [Cellulomonas dongxiuzhuiae]
MARLERHKVAREPAEQAEELANRGTQVHVIHLGIDYGRARHSA